MQLNFTLTIEAWDFAVYDDDHEIDVINKSIAFEETRNKVTIAEKGTNGIGLFNFSYSVQKYECSTDSGNSTDQPLEESSVTTSFTNPLPTSNTCNASVLIHSSTDKSHRLQLSRNLRDSPGSLQFVPGPGMLLKLSRKSP